PPPAGAAPAPRGRGSTRGRARSTDRVRSPLSRGAHRLRLGSGGSGHPRQAALSAKPRRADLDPAAAAGERADAVRRSRRLWLLSRESGANGVRLWHGPAPLPADADPRPLVSEA